MKTIFLTSDIGASVKIDGVRHACPMDNSNGLVKQIKESVKNFDNFVFIVSNPACETNDMYANVTFESFKMSGVGFKNLIVVDNRNKQNIEKIIKAADFVFLSGGHTPTQNQFCKEMNLAKLLKAYNGVVMGQSAGSMNLAKRVYNYPESLDELDDPKFMDGLDLTNFTIIPHFNLEKGNEQVDEGIDLMNDYLKKDSHTLPFYCLTNGSHIKISNGNAKFYGQIYLMQNGKIKSVPQATKQLN